MSSNRKSLWSVVLAVITLIGAANRSYAFQNEPDGFRGIAWGTTFELVKDQFYPDPSADIDRRMRQMGVKPAPPAPLRQEISYLRKNDSHNIGGAEIHAIFYTFYKGKFRKVGMLSNDKDALVAAFRATFGDATDMDAHGLSWIGENSGIGLNCNSRECEAVIYSFSLLAQKLHDDAEIANGAKKDF